MFLQLPALQDDGPAGDYYGRFSNRDQGSRGGSRERRGGSRISRGRSSSWDSDNNDGDDLYRRGGRSFRSNNNSARNLRSSEVDWLIGGRRSNRSSSFGSRPSSFGSKER